MQEAQWVKIELVCEPTGLLLNLPHERNAHLGQMISEAREIELIEGVEILHEPRRPSRETTYHPGVAGDGLGSPVDLTEHVPYVYTITFAAASVALTFLHSMKPVIVEWIRHRYDRSVTVKLGDKEVSIKGGDDLEKAIAGLEKLKSMETKKQLEEGL